jgi:hypothetical protein
MFRFLLRNGALLVFIASAVGCGGSDGAQGPIDSTPTVSCAMDPRLDSYMDEVDKSGERGLISFRFFDLEPSPPAKGNNTFHVQMHDAAGDPMLPDLRVDLRMPDHGHGTSVEPVISADPALESYTVAPLYLFMPGVWRLAFEAFVSPAPDTDPPDDTMLDRVVLHFCVEG